MKALICHVSELSYEDKQRSNRPAELIVEGDEPQVGEFGDAVVAFVTVEIDDHVGDATSMAEEVARAAIDVGSSVVVVMPFAHLSSDLAKAPLAKALLKTIGESLRDRFDVTVVTFGFHKRLQLTIDILGHKGSVAFRNSRRH